MDSGRYDVREKSKGFDTGREAIDRKGRLMKETGWRRGVTERRRARARDIRGMDGRARGTPQVSTYLPVSDHNFFSHVPGNCRHESEIIENH